MNMQAKPSMQVMPPPIKHFELEYFDVHGRALQLRMLAWYCSVPHTNVRRSFPEFGARKGAGKYKFGSMPVANFQDGTQLGQTQSMMRWIGSSCKGKKGETLYPGRRGAEAAWEIDALIEESDAFLGRSWGGYLGAEPVTDEKAREVCSTVWRELLTKLEKVLSRGKGRFLVGDMLTIADFSWGAWILKFYVANTF